MSTTESLFIRAAFSGDLDLLKKLVAQLDDGSGDIAQKISDIRGPCRMTPLHGCILNGQLDVCKYFIDDLKLDIHLKEKNTGDTPLHCAVKGRFYEIAVYLLEKGANPEIPSNASATALHCATGNDHVKVLHLLLSKGANVDALSIDGTTLRVAAAKGNHRAVKLLLKYHANPNLSHRQSPTPLLTSVFGKFLRCTNLLLEAGADPDLPAMGLIALVSAAANGQTDMVLSLLKAGANPNVTEEEGLTPIEVAAVNRCKDLVEILFPVTSPIPSYLDWSVTGIMRQVHTVEARVQRELKEKEIYENAKFKGDAAFREKDYTYAAFCYNQALNGNPPNTAAILSNKSLCWFRQYYGDRALEDAIDCIKLKPDWPKAYYRAGSALSQLLRFDEASSMFAKALELDPNNKEIQKAFQDSIAEVRMKVI